MNFKKLDIVNWTFYLDVDRHDKLKTNKCGKWMYFFDDSEKGIAFAKSICEKAVKSGVVIEAKHTHELFVPIMNNSGVCCFYCDGSNVEAHKKIISFFLENGMIRRTKTGKLYNISFKYDSQTHDGKYGEEFKSCINLKDFVNLETGEWLPEIKING
jgi:hypothetical protein